MSTPKCLVKKTADQTSRADFLAVLRRFTSAPLSSFCLSSTSTIIARRLWHAAQATKKTAHMPNIAARGSALVCRQQSTVTKLHVDIMQSQHRDKAAALYISTCTSTVRSRHYKADTQCKQRGMVNRGMSKKIDEDNNILACGTAKCDGTHQDQLRWTLSVL